MAPLTQEQFDDLIILMMSDWRVLRRNDARMKWDEVCGDLAAYLKSLATYGRLRGLIFTARVAEQFHREVAEVRSVIPDFRSQ